jgi:ABC-type transport system involved in multi-copper enzyme maturation permease subunit
MKRPLEGIRKESPVVRVRRLAWIARLAAYDFLRSRGLLLAGIFVLCLALLGLAGRFLAGEAEEGARFVLSFNLQASYVAGLILTWAAAIRQVAPEIERRTMLVLLARPVERWEVLAMKALATGIFGVVAISFFTLLVLLASPVPPDLSALFAAQLLLLRALAVCLLAVLAVTLSLVLPAVVNGLLLVGMFFGGGFLVDRAASYLPGALAPLAALAVPDFRVFDVTEAFAGGLAPVSAPALGSAILYGFLLSATWLAAGAVLFERRKL